MELHCRLLLARDHAMTQPEQHDHKVSHQRNAFGNHKPNSLVNHRPNGQLSVVLKTPHPSKVTDPPNPEHPQVAPKHLKWYVDPWHLGGTILYCTAKL